MKYLFFELVPRGVQHILRNGKLNVTLQAVPNVAHVSRPHHRAHLLPNRTMRVKNSKFCQTCDFLDTVRAVEI